MTQQTAPQLSKSRYIAGLQCLKRLWLEVYRHDLADEVSAGQQALFDSGTAVGELARKRFPDGVLIQEPYYAHAQAVRSTQALLSDVFRPALYEAAFAWQDIRTRVDILARVTPREFDLIEVKSSTSLKKKEHIPDIAIQLYITEGCGVPVRRACLMHIDNSYVYEGGEHDLDRLFTLEDVTDRARRYIETELPAALEGMRGTLQQDAAPPIETGRQCAAPYRCSFYDHCHQNQPPHPILELPRLGKAGYEQLSNAGIRTIDAVPPDYPDLTELQRRVWKSVTTGQPHIGPDLAPRLREIRAPITFMDFETLSAAVPVYIGTRPYQNIPFLSLIHI